MLECGFEFSGFKIWHFLKLVVRDFLWVLWFLPSFIGCPCLLSVRVGDSSRRSEEIVKYVELRPSVRLVVVVAVVVVVVVAAAAVVVFLAREVLYYFEQSQFMIVHPCPLVFPPL